MFDLTVQMAELEKRDQAGQASNSLLAVLDMEPGEPGRATTKQPRSLSNAWLGGAATRYSTQIRHRAIRKSGYSDRQTRLKQNLAG